MSRLTDLKLTTIVKLGSILVHAEEILDDLGYHGNGWVQPADLSAIKTLLADPEIEAWRKIMDNAGLLPKRRTPRN